MANPLIEKMRAALSSQVESSGHKFTVRRPTVLEMHEMQRADEFDQRTVLRRFVIGWDIKEIDLIPGGSPVDVAFSPDLFEQWVSDHPEHWETLTQAIINGYTAHQEAMGATAKN